jgi:hypothetical protein
MHTGHVLTLGMLEGHSFSPKTTLVLISLPVSRHLSTFVALQLKRVVHTRRLVAVWTVRHVTEDVPWMLE